MSDRLGCDAVCAGFARQHRLLLMWHLSDYHDAVCGFGLLHMIENRTVDIYYHHGAFLDGVMRPAPTLLMFTVVFGAASVSGMYLNQFAQSASNGDYSSLTFSTVSATQVSSTNVSFSMTSSGYCSADHAQSNIQFVSVDVTPILSKFDAANISQGHISMQCTRPAFPQCFFYDWVPIVGLLEASKNPATNMSWPSPYTGNCVSYSNAEACAGDTYKVQQNVAEGNLTSHAPCAPSVLPFTWSDVQSFGGALLVGLKIPYSTAVCGSSGGFLSLTCVVVVTGDAM